MNIKKIVNQIIKEATSEIGSRGSYAPPLQPGLREFKDEENGPFTIPVSKYFSPLLAYDSYDNIMGTPKKKRKKLETIAKRISNKIKNNPNLTISDEDGNPINPTPGKNKKIVPIRESQRLNETMSTITTAGEYTGPMEIGLKKWDTHSLAPFTDEVSHIVNHISKQKTLKKNVNRVVGVWEKNADGTYDVPTYDVDTIKEDLAVWFGTKKKPKGSKQPKGPWVDICRKVNGKHPPCGRSDADKGSYPKCRAIGVAGKMSDSEKRSACQQKRRAEKNDPQRGKGQKPVMTSHKKINNESVERLVGRIVSGIRDFL